MNDLTKKILKASRSNERGFSIMQVMMIASLLGVVSVGTISFIKRGTDQQRSLTVQDDVRSVSTHIASYLMNNQACLNTFGGKRVFGTDITDSTVNTAQTHILGEFPLIYGSSVAAIKNKDNAEIFKALTAANYNNPLTRTVYGNRSIRLRYITVGGSGIEPRTGLARYDTSTHQALVQLEWEANTNTVVPEVLAGPQRFSRFFRINVTLDGSNQITACDSTGEVTSNTSSCLSGSTTYSTASSSASFLVPNYDLNLTASVTGAGGGGAGDEGMAAANGGTGGSSSFGDISATGGAGGVTEGGAIGTGGGGIGGDTNASGNIGFVGTGGRGGAGGSAGGPGSAQGGLSSTANGNAGSSGGGGGGGAYHAGTGGSGGGGGGYATKLYEAGELTPGGHVAVTVGAGGTGGAGTKTGGTGGAGKVVVAWTCQGSLNSAADNLGNHTMTANLNIGYSGGTAGYYWISGDGDDEGISVTENGWVGINTVSPAVMLDVPGGMKVGDDDNPCTADKAGTIIWDLGTAAAQYCNGTGPGWTTFSSGASSPGSGVYYDYKVFTANGTWTKPTGLNGEEPVFVQAWGGGGGGVNSIQGGGGGGAYNQAWFRASDLSATEAVVVGAGGTTGASPTAGGNSSFDNLVAYGGGGGGGTSGGGGGTLSASSSGAGGSPGGGATGNPGADSTMGGGGGTSNAGANGGKSYFGGGGAGRDAGDGGSSVYGGGGGGGGSAGGVGGTSVFGGAGGDFDVDGTAPGGGGGGGAGAGGAGARGEVRVWTLVGKTSATPDPADDLGDHVMLMNLRTGNYYISGDGGNEGLFIDSTGNVGVGNSTPRAKLDVSGAIVGAAATANATTTIDFSLGNMQTTSLACTTFTLTNMLDGGSYTLVVENTGAGTCDFSAAGLAVQMPVDHSAVTGGKTVYTFLVVGTRVYVAWLPGT